MSGSLFTVVGGGLCVIGVGFIDLGVVCMQVNNLSRVVWASEAGVIRGFLCDMEHGVGKTMLMRGGACAAELRLMVERGGLYCG